MPKPSLRRLLGLGQLKPPTGKPSPPDFAALGAPPTLPGGALHDPALPLPQDIEALAAPEDEAAYPEWRREGRAAASKPHWHEGRERLYFHRGAAWGVVWPERRWAWLPRSGNRWWAQAGGKLPLLRHQDRWWWRTGDGWFLLHDGQPWAYRRFHEWRSEGLIHPASGTRVVYSADGLRAAVVTPGEDTVVFDLRTGAELGRWRPED